MWVEWSGSPHATPGAHTKFGQRHGGRAPGAGSGDEDFHCFHMAPHFVYEPLVAALGKETVKFIDPRCSSSTLIHNRTNPYPVVGSSDPAARQQEAFLSIDRSCGISIVDCTTAGIRNGSDYETESFGEKP